MRVYLVRHGKTGLGASFQFQSADTPLSSLGVHQARALIPRLQGVPLSVIYTSSYMRAKMTADILRTACDGCAHEVEDIFIEKNNSSRILGHSYISLPGMQLACATLWNLIRPAYRWSDEETLYELAARARQAREFLESQSQKYSAVLTVSHALFLSALMMEIQSEDVSGYLSTSTPLPVRLYRGIRLICLGLSMKNCALYTFDYETSKKLWTKI